MLHVRYKQPAFIWIIGTVLFWSFSCSKPSPETQIDPSTDRLQLADEIEQALRQHVIDPWYPRSVDSVYGGFVCDYDFQWQPNGQQHKMIVSQGRHTWSCSKFAAIYPEERFEEFATHGFNYLQQNMWDQQHGGFYSILNREGEVLNGIQWGNFKTAYGNSFGIYGLAAYIMLTDNDQAFTLAKEAFTWLDAHAHDPQHGGYFQFISRTGDPSVSGSENIPPKDQNSTIHLLEAFTELYQVWPDDTLRDRLDELLVLVRDVITTEKGYMNLFFNQDWSPVLYKDSLPEIREAHYNIDHVSFGHDVETAYLLMEASEALGIENDQKTMTIAKKMVDHALNTGWDNEAGGFYDRGYYFPNEQEISIITDSKVWWSQGEALNTLLIMSELYPDDPMDYFQKFEMQWEYMKSNIFDHENSGVFVEGLDTSPESKERDKGGTWKVNYHTARSLMNCMNMLRSDHHASDH